MFEIEIVVTKIFRGGDSDEMDTDADQDVEEDTSTPASTKWPWEAVRNKLVEALTEMTVLSDVISIATKECGKDSQVRAKIQ